MRGCIASLRQTRALLPLAGHRNTNSGSIVLGRHMYFAYRGRLGEFLKEDPDAIIGRLHQSVAEDGFSRLWNTQTSAWREEVALLQTACRQLIAATEKAIGWTILLEYEIARRGRRIDAVLLTNRAIVVLEFKVGLQAADSSSRWQVYEYALDLRDFHGDSGHHLIVPIVVPSVVGDLQCAAARAFREAAVSGALRLVQHAVSSPVGFLRRCGGVAFECARSDAARLCLAGGPTPWPLRPPVDVARGSQSPPPSPDRVTARRLYQPELSPALASAF